VGRSEQRARSLLALVAAIALALQLMLPMQQPAAAAANAADICHSAPTAHHHDGKHGAPSGRAGCDWCMLCGKLGTAVGPLDPVAGLPQRTLSPVAIFVTSIDFSYHVSRPRAGPVGARAPPEIA
jgi:hypothetical protein